MSANLQLGNDYRVQQRTTIESDSEVPALSSSWPVVARDASLQVHIAQRTAGTGLDVRRFVIEIVLGAVGAFRVIHMGRFLRRAS
jgi:hypothetical protein